jgi:flagellar basal body rod protein FlgG
MSREIYPAMTAASASMRHLDHVSHNLSNVNTAGFKERRISFQSVLAQAQQGPLSEGYVQLTEGKINVESGSLMQDNNPTHFALEGNGFFVVQSASGEPLLTRAGIFQLDRNGYLVNAMGEKVMTVSGPIQFDDYQREEFTVTEDGRLMDERGGEFARLLIMDGDDLEPLAGTRWRASNLREITDNTFVVRQGMLETSNVNPFRTMIEMMETTRHFEMYQKSMQASKEMDSTLNQMTHRT